MSSIHCTLQADYYWVALKDNMNDYISKMMNIQSDPEIINSSC